MFKPTRTECEHVGSASILAWSIAHSANSTQ